MSIERLSFNSASAYDAVELSIHIARYATAQKLCENLNVLDVACGEGYGAYAMAELWDAGSVKAVDISEEAIETARNIFSHPKIEYFTAAAEKIDSLFAAHSFDLVVSLETIEHLAEPEIFLAAITKVLKPNGIVILSCPNDHWYYGEGESQNPFHLKTYYFDEFRDLAEKHLGDANCYLLGRPVTGFGNFLWSAGDATSLPQTTMTDELKNLQTTEINLLNSDETLKSNDCSFFVGVWGDLSVTKENLVNCAIYSTSMDKSSSTLQDNNKMLQAQTSALAANLDSSQKWNEQLQSFQSVAQTRISDLEKWTIELQTALKNSEIYVSELEKLTAESQNRVLNLERQAESLEQETKSLQIDLNEANKELEIVRLKAENFEQQSENFQQELEIAKNRIEQMEESKFWKLRDHWFNLKDNIKSNK